ncbi:hypothetical protein UPYG_G00307720 [Umbra pygmaea]|uniref:C2H2-type domain-containing protein n=1 Tax=Umbra pygmaea TaxID=75934 RepID=A0ABD0VYW2_UMBPY
MFSQRGHRQTDQTVETIEAQDYLHKWYSSRIEEIDYDEGKMLVHFDRWSHRYDEWIAWDSARLRPLVRPVLRKEGLKEDEESVMTERLSEMSASRLGELPGCTESTEDQTELPQPRQELRDGVEVLARWTDCRYYPAKIESVNKEGTYTVQFYDGVIRCVKRIHIKSMPDDAKGQDWIALVKAASAAANSKGGSKPRTSANSNKDRDDTGGGRSDDEGDEELDEGPQEQSDSDKLDGMESEDDERETMDSTEPPDVTRSNRRRNRPDGSLCHSKRARASKTTDDSDCKEKSTEGPVMIQLEGQGLADESKGDVEMQTGSSSSVTGSLARCRTRRHRQHSGESNSSSSHTQKQMSRQPCSITALCHGEETVSAPESKLSPSTVCPGQATSGRGELVPPGSPGSSEQNQAQPLSLRRRRSQRLATVSFDVTSDPTMTSNPTPCPDSSPPGQGSDHNAPQNVSVCEDGQVANCLEKDEPSTLHNYCAAAMPPSPPPAAPVTTPCHPPVTHTDQLTDDPAANLKPVGDKFPPLVTAPSVRAPIRTSKMNKHTREPIMNIKRSEDPTSPNDLEDYRCKIVGCAKAFRKAKLLDYHLKYYHNTDKELQDSEPTMSPDRGGRTRATSASMPTTLLEVPDNAKRRRTVSTSASMSPQGHMFQLDCSGPPKFNRKKRSSASLSSDSTERSLPPQDFESLQEKILRKVIDKDKHLEPGFVKLEKKVKLEEKCQMGKKKEKERRDRKEKGPFKIKQKKKKKKKKKSKQHCYSDYNTMALSFLERSRPSPLHRASAFTFLPSSSTSSSKGFQYPRAILSVDLTGENLSDIDFLEDSTTESLLLSGDEYNQEVDSLTMEDFPEEEEEDGSQEIVRCICEMDEENGFMIQCEECMCWQHSVCMGLLEDSIPDQYICYICRDPPGQRWSAKYLHDKEWLNRGHMYGLSFVTENYCQQNSKKIVSTHQLLADVFSVNKILNGLQLKMDILRNKHNPNLHFWARSWVNSDEDQPMGGLPDCIHFTGHLDDNPLGNSSNLDTYITSEHSYQKPPGLGHLEHWPPADRTPGDGAAADGHCPTRPVGGLGFNPASDLLPFPPKQDEDETALAVPGFMNDSGPDSVEHARNCLQWQMNLLTHIEDVQNQVAGRMDLIEKELDVLETWLDFTGELEPPDPLARLPQLKQRIKLLLTDLCKVQQMSTLCSI